MCAIQANRLLHPQRLPLVNERGLNNFPNEGERPIHAERMIKKMSDILLMQAPGNQRYEELLSYSSLRGLLGEAGVFNLCRSLQNNVFDENNNDNWPKHCIMEVILENCNERIVSMRDKEKEYFDWCIEYYAQRLRMPNADESQYHLERMLVSMKETLIDRVNTQMQYILNTTITEAGVQVDPRYQIDHLTEDEHIQLYEHVMRYVQDEKVVKYHLFEIEDLILRDVVEDLEKGKKYLSLINPALSLFDKIQDVCTYGSRFGSPDNFQLEDAEKGPFFSEPPRPKILKLSLENERNIIGGIGSAVCGLAVAHRELDSYKVYSMHPLYEKDKVKEYKFLGVISHLYAGEICRSSIYKDLENNEYLVQPPRKFCHLFNIGSGQVYGKAGKRSDYLGSAGAAFAMYYRGKLRNKCIGVVQSETPLIGGITFPLLKTVYSSMRQDIGLASIKTAQVIHWGNIDIAEWISRERLQEVGLDEADPRICLYRQAARFSDVIIPVSLELASRVMSPDASISHGYSDIIKQHAIPVAPIRNGIDSKQFDITDSETFGEFALKRTFAPDGTETTDYMAHRQYLKQVLYSNGVIPDSKLPLMVYVGRYALDKGMDVLTEVIKRGPKEMQYVTMGVSQEYLMDELLQLSEGSHRDRLFVYTTLEEQKARFNFRDETHEVTIGQLIRAAADIFIVPSHIEACGLVAMEARCAGAMLIAPYHQGLQDICLPGSNPEHFIESDADAVCYRDHHNVEEALAATSACTKILHSMSRKERNQLAARLRNSSMENYSWFFEDAKHRTGVAMRYNHLYDRLLTQS